jgi:uroporphyrinogen-III synthase
MSPAPTVLVTRPARQAADWVERLRTRGVDARALPLLAIEPSSEPAALHDAWRTLDRQALAMFVSPNAVDAFFAARPADAAWPPALRVAATGPGSVAALVGAGVPRAQCTAPAAPPYDSSALWALLAPETWAGRPVLIVRGDGGRDEFAQSLRAAGAHVRFVQAYRRSAPDWSAAERALAQAALAAPQAHVWLLSSAEALGHLPALLPGAAWRDASALASHPRIAERARGLGFGDVREVAPTLDAVLAALEASGALPAS